MYFRLRVDGSRKKNENNYRAVPEGIEKTKGKSGDGVEEDDSKWFAFQSLLFLRDKWKPHKTTEAGIEVS